MMPSEKDQFQPGKALPLNESEPDDEHRDTVWHTVHVHSSTRRDTINVYSAEEAADTLKRMSNSYTVVKKEVKVKKISGDSAAFQMSK